MARAKGHAAVLDDLIRKHPTPDELHAAFAGLRPHSLRGAALSAAAQLDLALMVALVGKLRPSLSRDEHAYLFGQNGPYATAMSKIHVLYSISVIGLRSKKELQLLQRIRNVFAHAAVPVDFDTPAIKAACESLVTFDILPEYGDGKIYPKRDLPWKTPKDKYTTAVRIYSDRLLRYFADETDPQPIIKNGLAMMSWRAQALP